MSDFYYCSVSLYVTKYLDLRTLYDIITSRDAQQMIVKTTIITHKNDFIEIAKKGKR